VADCHGSACRRGRQGMRDRRFIAEHRGGPLNSRQHRQLSAWACACAEAVLPVIAEAVDERLLGALATAAEWRGNLASVGEARRAAAAALSAARAAKPPAAVAVARAVAHAVATAHMADHSLAAALYALKAVKVAGGSVDLERKRQDARLPRDIRRLVLSASSGASAGARAPRWRGCAPGAAC